MCDNALVAEAAIAGFILGAGAALATGKRANYEAMQEEQKKSSN